MNDTQMVAQPIPDREQEWHELSLHVEQALDCARKAGADAAEAHAGMQAGISVQTRMAEVETLEHNRDRELSVTVYVGRSKGHASCADLRPASIEESVRRAVDIARFTYRDKFNGLADPERLATEFPDLDLWHPRPMDVDETIERALACESAGLADKRIRNSEGASASCHFGLSVYGNTHGFVGRSAATRYGQSCILIAGEGSSMQRDYWYDSRRLHAELESPEQTGQEAARRTVARLGARQINTARVPVLFAAPVARSLLGNLVGAVSGTALYRNASFLKDQAGETIFPAWFDLEELPFIPRALGSAAFDAEGVATQERKLVDGGVLTGYVLSSYSARRLGLETTGNAGGVHNLRPSGREVPFDALLQEMDRGLLVTEFMGQGVSMVTGDYSRGASGFWVEDGAIAHPVEEVTVAGNLRNMFAAIRALGNDRDERGTIQSGSILVDGMTVAGS
ncbi:MAG: metalloprotease PmbA [Xanthomonadales bacterium]|nr:metalloprotease PmbA [Xanthomonadales bacterium]